MTGGGINATPSGAGPGGELRRVVPVTRASIRRVEAQASELLAIARRLMLPEVRALACDYVLEPAGGGTVRAEGRLRARVVQVCVDTLEPFEAALAEDFAVRFVPEGKLSPTLDVEAEDEIPYTGDTVDLGEATVEQLALALDPYPRATDAQ